MKAYCMKCRQQRESKGSVQEKGGRSQFRGTCGTCGCKVVKFVSGTPGGKKDRTTTTEEAAVPRERDTQASGIPGLKTLHIKIPSTIDTRPEDDDLAEIAMAVHARLVDLSVGGGQGASVRAAAAARINAALNSQSGAGLSANTQLGGYIADMLVEVLLAQGVSATPESWGRLVPRKVAAASGSTEPPSAVEAALNLLLPGEYDLGGNGQIDTVTVGGRALGAAAGEAGAQALLGFLSSP